MFKKLGLSFVWFLATPLLLGIAVLYLHTHNKPKLQLSIQPIITSEIENVNTLDGQVLGVEITDTRPFIVERFLSGTPLAAHAALIIQASDKYNLDYRLIPAIAMKEAQGGLTARPESYNAWGFENGRTNFDSWETAIESVAKTLKTRYVDRGLTTPEAMMPIYAPPQMFTGGKWAKDINFFFSQMESL